MLLSLPVESLEEILLRLDGAQMLALRLVSRTAAAACSSDSLWRARIRGLTDRSPCLVCVTETHDCLLLARMEEDLRTRRNLITMIDQRVNTSTQITNPTNFYAQCGPITQSLCRVEPLDSDSEDEGGGLVSEPYSCGDHLVALVNGLAKHAITVRTPKGARTRDYLTGTIVLYQRANAVRQADPMRWRNSTTTPHPASVCRQRGRSLAQSYGRAMRPYDVDGHGRDP
jgi:hypothetical protein